jgi:hypothetical protein
MLNLGWTILLFVRKSIYRSIGHSQIMFLLTQEKDQIPVSGFSMQ